MIDATGAVGAIEDGMEATAELSSFRVDEEVTVVGSMAVPHSFERARDLPVTGAIDAER